jgi:hypothetical protein
MQNEHISAVKNLATTLTKALDGQGIKLKHTQALEIVSKLQNHTDWNRLNAKLRGKDSIHPPATNLAAFGLVAPCGYGKSEVMRALFEIECVDGATCPLYICITGCAHQSGGRIWGNDDFLAKKDRLTVIYSRSGIVSVKSDLTAPCRAGTGKGVLVNFRPQDDVFLGDGVIAAFVQMLENLEHYLPKNISGRIGTVFVDEFHRFEMDAGASDVAMQALGSYLRRMPSARRLVIASQIAVVSSAIPLLGIPFSYVLEPGRLKWLSNDMNDVQKIDQTLANIRWTSKSIDDHAIVHDLFWQSVNTVRYRLYYHQNGDSRLNRLPDTMLWYRDLKKAIN